MSKPEGMDPADAQEALQGDSDELIPWCGLMVTRKSLAELGKQLERINEAERQAWASLRSVGEVHP